MTTRLSTSSMVTIVTSCASFSLSCKMRTRNERKEVSWPILILFQDGWRMAYTLKEVIFFLEVARDASCDLRRNNTNGIAKKMHLIKAQLNDLCARVFFCFHLLSCVSCYYSSLPAGSVVYFSFTNIQCVPLWKVAVVTLSERCQQANGWANLIECWGVTWDGIAPHSGGVAIHLGAS